MSAIPISAPEAKKNEILGHPIGLATLFFTELWERLSYYGMRAILMLYMTKTVAEGALSWPTVKAAGIYGAYTSAVYLLAIPGGWVADNVLGARMAVLVGGIIIAIGHYTIALATIPSFYTGLVLIVLGTGLLKPNISAMVGGLYREGDLRRDAGFSIFYMGINLGAFLAPFVCGFLAQSETFRHYLASHGMRAENSWHWGFGAAGVGMTLGLLQYILGKKYLASVGNNPEKFSKPVQIAILLTYLITPVVFLLMLYKFDWARYVIGLIIGAAVTYVIGKIIKESTIEEIKRLASVVVFFAAAALFWAVFEQAGSSLTLFADQMTDNMLFSISFPSSFFQAVNPLFIIGFAPVFAWLWVRWGERQPSSPTKFSIGLLFAGLGFFLAAISSKLAGDTKVASMWLVGVYFLHTVGELCLSPVGLSTMTKLSPQRLVGLVMGVWFLAPAVGNYVGGMIAGHFDAKDPSSVIHLFNQVGIAAVIGAVIMFVLMPVMKKLMGGVK